MGKNRSAVVITAILYSILVLVPTASFGAGLTYSFDDGHLATYTRALPILESHGQVGTVNVVYFWTGRSDRVTFDQMKEMESRGWEVCSHSLTHPRFDQIPQRKSEAPLEGWISSPGKSYTYEAPYGYQSLPFVLADDRMLRNVKSMDEVEATPGSAFFDPSGSRVYIHLFDHSSPEHSDIQADSVEMELEQSKLLLEAHGLNIQSFVVPFSIWNEERAQMSQTYYRSAGSAGNFNDIPPENPYYLRRLQVESHHTVEEVKALVDAAVDDDSWLILMFHGIGYPEEGCISLCWTPEQLDELAAYVSGCDIRVVTQREGLALMPGSPGTPIPDLKIDSQDDNITISIGNQVACTFSLDPGSCSGKDADWWFFVDTDSGVRFFFDGLKGRWVTKEIPALQKPLCDFPYQLIRHQVIDLKGTHTFYCGVDLIQDGMLDELNYLDSVRVTVQEQ